jgi:hypothetical protein
MSRMIRPAGRAARRVGRPERNVNGEGDMGRAARRVAATVRGQRSEGRLDVWKFQNDVFGIGKFRREEDASREGDSLDG